MTELDVRKNGIINYSEFLAATLSLQEFVTEEKMWMIFKRFDVDNTDFISKKNIADAMKKLGKTITEEEIADSLKEHDKTHNGQISFEEFKLIFGTNVKIAEDGPDRIKSP